MTALFWELVNMRTSFPKVYLISQRIINKEKYRGKNAACLLSLLIQLLLLFVIESKVMMVARIVAAILFL